MKESVKEIIVYGIVSISSLTMLAYTVHMFVGGLVDEDTEHFIMLLVVLAGAIAIGFMVRDVIKRRRENLDQHSSGK